ncbi:MAG: hypothetical protein HY908_17270, partial [Myxococcales bacterium]|nr:hypothetical protein [Myxococcales bacterium]
MSKRSLGLASLAALASGLGCGTGARVGREPVVLPVIAPTQAGADDRPAAPSGPALAPGECPAGSRPDRFDGCAPERDAAERAGLDAAIGAAEQTIRDEQYRNGRTLVELARLELVRDGRDADHDGPNDAARAQKNAMRAVAVDATTPGAGLVLALARARSTLEVVRRSGAEVRAPALALAGLAARAATRTGDWHAAAATALVGFARLDAGDAADARAPFDEAVRSDPSGAAG